MRQIPQKNGHKHILKNFHAARLAALQKPGIDKMEQEPDFFKGYGRLMRLILLF
jgi:hypothetical protein